jgi:sulfate transport system ATP-binding protein
MAIRARSARGRCAAVTKGDIVSIEVLGISKRFGVFAALHDVNLTIPDGELVALLGPSGSGKTTLLRVIAGLDYPDNGRVLFDGVDAVTEPVQTRKVGFVFQHYALFRHMTVFENVAFGLRVRPRSQRPSDPEIKKRVRELLALVQLEMVMHRYPSQLSGGQRQRVALARALAVQPRVLLLDEPFGALDAKVRQELRRWLRRLHDELHVTSVFVTHDQEEALELADAVVIMNDGRIEQVGTPDAVYNAPATPFVYQFIGDVNVFHGRLDRGRLQMGTFEMPVTTSPESRETATVGVRPHQLTIEPIEAQGLGFRASVVHINAAGATVKVQLKAPWGDVVRVEMPQERYRHLALARESEVFVRIDANSCYVAPA